MKPYETRFPPYPHQAVANDKMRGHAAFALLMAMRTGKTKVTLDDFGQLELNGEVDDCLILAPAGVYRTWEKAIDEHLSTDLRKRCRVYTWSASKNSRAEKQALEFFMSFKGPRFLLINIEALSSVDRAHQVAKQFASQRRCYGVVDESTMIKNVDAERTVFIAEKLAPLLSYRRILSGLPTPRSPLDLFSQFWFLDRGILGFENYKTFEKRYATINRICMLPMDELRGRLQRRWGGRTWKNIEGIGRVDISDMNRDMIVQTLLDEGVYLQTIPKLAGYKNQEELRDKIAPYSYRITLLECGGLPPFYTRREVTMTDQQKRMYKSMVDFATAEIENDRHVTATVIIAKMIRLHQILCGHTVDEENVEHDIKENRTAELMKLLEEYDGKAIVWCSYDKDIRKVSDALRKEYGEKAVARFWGGNRAVREAEEVRFKTDPECRFMVATASAGGRGRTWDVAKLIVYYSNTNDLEKRLQSEERASGVTMTEGITIVDLVVPSTVDEKILYALREKMNLSDVITGDNWREWVV